MRRIGGALAVVAAAVMLAAPEFRSVALSPLPWVQPGRSLRQSSPKQVEVIGRMHAQFRREAARPADAGRPVWTLWRSAVAAVG
jgi:hypothetical protein